jgi:hypothetical protein
LGNIDLGAPMDFYAKQNRAQIAAICHGSGFREDLQPQSPAAGVALAGFTIIWLTQALA